LKKKKKKGPASIAETVGEGGGLEKLRTKGLRKKLRVGFLAEWV